MKESTRLDTEKPLILVVDDEIGPRESLKIILLPDYRVVAASDGPSALLEFDRETPDLVISDIRMPGMSGTSLLCEIKSRGPDVPVILITGYATLQSAQEAVRGGAFDYINKPYDVEEIQQTVSKAVSEFRKRRNSHRLVNQLQSWNRDLQQQIGQLDQKAKVADLSAELIHDLNNPMTVLQGYISLLEDSFGPDSEGASVSEMEEFMGIVKTQVERCVTLTRNFLDFARESGNHWEKSNLNELIQDSLFVLRVRMMKMRIESNLSLEPDLPEGWFMSTAIQQVFYNLISNAIDAIGDNGEAGIITITSRLVESKMVGDDKLSSCIRATISDNGPGISRDIIDRIFIPFFSTKEKNKGTGLGLSLCKRIIDEHQGELRVESEPGQGTSFIITIPLLLEAPNNVV